MKTTKHEVGQLARRGQFRAESFNDSEKSVEVTFSSDEPAMMWNWDIGSFKEVLSHDPAHVRLGRMKNGVSLLDNHNSWGSVRNIILGSAIDPKIENGQGTCLVRLSEDEEHQGFVKNVKKKIIKDLSVGYRVYKYEELTMPGDEVRTLKAVDWEPYEVSFVAIPADANAQVRSQKPESSYQCEIISREDSLKTKSVGDAPVTEPVVEPVAVTSAVTEPVVEPVVEPVSAPVEEPKVDEVQAEQERALEIMESCQAHGLKMDFARKLITDKTEIGLARKLIINKIAEEKGSMQTQNNNVTVLVDEREKKRALAETALSLRLGVATGEIANEARALRNLSLTELAKELDPSLRSMAKKDVAARAMHSTSDFPLLFGNVANKALMKSYQVAPKTFLPFVNKVSMSDFKESSKIKWGSAPQLLQIAEGGEYEYGTVGEGSEKMKLSKYGRKIRITEEMFINDDLGALAQLPAKFGNSSAALESALVYAILTGNPLMADGVALFHATHKNLGTAGAPSETTFDEMVQKFLEQKDGENFLNINPRFVIAGPKNRTAILKLLASLSAVGKSGDVNIFQNGYEPIIDANITDKSWFAAADPAQTETIDIGYLDGMEGPEVKSIADEANDSILLKCKHVFVAKAVDHKGLFKNPYV